MVLVAISVIVAIGQDSYASPKSSVVAPRCPGPSSTSADGEVVPSEAEPCTEETYDGSGDDIKAVVVEIRVSCRRDVDCGAYGDQREDK